MSAGQDHTQTIDQLQREVNAILTQTGRLFAAANNGSREAPLAQASKLKKMMPDSINRFHEALDLLEDELQFARTVMRRDLAVLREQSGQLKKVPIQSTPTQGDMKEAGKVAPILEPKQPEELIEPEDLTAPPELEPAAAAEVTPESATTEKPDTAIDENPVVGQTPYVPSTEAHSKGLPPGVPVESAPEPSEEKASDAALHIDTKPTDTAAQDSTNQNADDDKEPDTGTFTNADMDSLFNDPTSAGAGETADFGAETGSGNDFDFGSFNANFDANAAGSNENEDLSSLLPGLQDYANTQPTSGEPDFNALFATDGGDNTQDSVQPATAQHDTTFDDLMDFNFDIGGGGDGDGANDNSDFDFSFS